MLFSGTCMSHTRFSSTLLCVFMAWTVLWDFVLSLQCPPCHKLHCSPKRASRLNCKGGVTTGVCGCCPVCAKQEGEECGGDFAYRGKCDRDLDCVLTPTTSTFLSKTHTLQTEPVGMCRKTSKKRPRGHQADAAFVEFCRPKCSPEFCAKRPRAVCSASDVADTIIDCHGRCQHTSCRACSFVQEPECPRCRRDDFRCLKKFGKCMRKHICTSRKKTCMWGNKVADRDRGKFVCRVPQCL